MVILENRNARKVIGLVIPFLASNACSSYGYKYTSVSINTVVFQTNIFFTYLIALFVLKTECFSVVKFLALAICMIGVVITTISNAGGFASDANFFVLLPVSGALSYAIYSSLYNLAVQPGLVNSAVDIQENLLNHESRIDEPNSILIFAWLGFYCAIISVPVILILHFTGCQVIPPFNLIDILILISVGILVALYNLCIGIALYYASPTLINTASILGVPLAIIADTIVVQLSFSFYFYMGSFLITLGFATMIWSEKIELFLVSLVSSGCSKQRVELDT